MTRWNHDDAKACDKCELSQTLSWIVEGSKLDNKFIKPFDIKVRGISMINYCTINIEGNNDETIIQQVNILII